MRTTIDMAREAGWDDHHAGFDTRIDRLVALVRADERALAAPVQEPVAHLWQHSQTGRTRIVMPGGIITADATWFVVGPLVLGNTTPPTAQPAPVQEPVAWRYDLAKYRENDLRGRQWAHSVFSPTKPYIDEMVRNVTPLYTTPPEQPAPEQYTALEQALTRLQKRYAELEAKFAAQPAPVQQILEAFPLLDDEGLDQDEHHCEWALQQDRKRLHTMLANGITKGQP